MKDKIIAGLSLACDFKGLLFRRITSPIRSAKIINFGLDLKNIFEQDKDTANMLCQTLDLIVQFRRENPEEYQEIFDIINEILDTHDEKRDSIHQNLKSLKDIF